MRNKISAREKNRKYKEEPNGNFKTVNTVAEIKTQWMSSSVECKRQRKESVNWKVEEQKLPNSEQQREKKKIPSQNRASGICRSITKDLTLYHWSLRKVGKGQS